MRPLLATGQQATQSATRPRRCERPSLVRAVGAVGVAGATVFLGVLTVLHFAVPGLSPVDDYVSDYANSSWAALFTVGILVHVVGNAAIAWGLAGVTPRGTVARAGVVLFAVATTGMVVAALFRTDPEGAAMSPSGLVHRYAATTSFVVEAAAVLLLALALGTEPGWHGHARLGRLVGTTGSLALLWLFAAAVLDAAPGLPERTVLLLFTVWELWTGWTLLRAGAAGRQREGAASHAR